MENLNAKVSVVMCTYNGALYIREQLDTIIHQTLPVYELIIQDDCSTDNTRAILEEYSQRYSYIHLHFLPQHVGVNDNFFSAIDKATGDYIAISDQDDIWCNNKLESQVRALQEQKAGLCFYSACPFEGEPATILSSLRQRPNINIHRALFSMGLASGHTFMLTKDFWNAYKQHVPLYDHGITNMYYDSMLYFSAILNREVAFLQMPYSQHRRLSTSVTMGKRKNLSQRSAINFIGQIYRNLGSKRRKKVQQIYANRFHNLALLATCWKDEEALRLINKMSLLYPHFWALTKWCVQNRDEIFYAKEKHEGIAILRALLFPIMHRDYVVQY